MRRSGRPSSCAIEAVLPNPDVLRPLAFDMRQDRCDLAIRKGISEGWHIGPQAPQIADPVQAGKVLAELARKARKNAGMNGLDLD